MHILHVVGARPNFMKAAPVLHALQARPGMRQTLVHTGQHYDKNLSDVFFSQLEIPRPRRQPRCRLRYARPPDRRHHERLRARPARAEAGHRAGLRRRKFDGRGRSGVCEIARSRGARRGGTPLLRPHHARGSESHRHRPLSRSSVHAFGRRRRESSPRRRLAEKNSPRRQRHDRFAGAPASRR